MDRRQFGLRLVTIGCAISFAFTTLGCDEKGGDKAEVQAQADQEAEEARTTKRKGSLEAQADVLWHAHAGGIRRSQSFSVTNSALYFVSLTGFSAVDAGSGEELWEVEPEDGKPLTSSTIPPAVSADHVFVNVNKGLLEDALWALDRKSGEVAWRFEKGPICDRAQLIDGTLWVSSVRKVDPAEVEGQNKEDAWLYGLDPATGEVKAGFELPYWSFTGCKKNPVLLTEKMAVVVVKHKRSSSTIRGLALADGAEQWSLEVKDPVTSLHSDGNRIYAATKRDGIQGIDQETGEVLWISDTSGTMRQLSTGSGVLMHITFSKVDGVIGHERLKVIDAETAEDLWEKKGPAKGRIGEAAIVDGKVLLSVRGDGSDSVVHVYDAASGDELGSFPATPGFRSPVLEDGKLYYFYGNGIAARKVPGLLKGTVAKGE